MQKTKMQIKLTLTTTLPSRVTSLRPLPKVHELINSHKYINTTETGCLVLLWCEPLQASICEPTYSHFLIEMWQHSVACTVVVIAIMFTGHSDEGSMRSTYGEGCP